ncbi:MAG: ATP phosphoribosyltransferase regulatory subunit [Alcanivorax sp.]
MSETDESLALLPNGFVDILPPHAEGEARSIDTLMDIFRSNGYLRIKPPILEFEDSLLAPGPGERLALETFRLMDPVSHRMLGVRSDITAQVARIVSSRLANEPRPLRLTYANDALRTRGSQMRTVRQFTQVGCELVDNTQALYPDIEICVLSILGLKSLGLKDLTLDLTVPGFVADLMNDIDEDDQPKAKKAVEQRDVEVLNALSAKAAGLIATAMQASGDAQNAFDVLAGQQFGDEIQAKLDQLKSLCQGIQDAFKSLDIDDVRITVDLIEQSGFEYHKNYGFTLFAADSRGELGRGGSYDIHFGQKLSSETARGFTLYMDTISRLIDVEPNEKSVFVPVDTPWHTVKDLQAQGWVTVRATEAEQSSSSCGYVYRNGKIEEQS